MGEEQQTVLSLFEALGKNTLERRGSPHIVHLYILVYCRKSNSVTRRSL